MTDIELRKFLDLLMCSDPWPVTDADNQPVLVALANRESIVRGYSDWIEAYHKLRSETAPQQKETV